MATGQDLVNVITYLQDNGKDPYAGLTGQQRQYIRDHISDLGGQVPDDIINAVRDNHRDMFNSAGQMHPGKYSPTGIPPPRLPERSAPPANIPGPGEGQPVNPNVTVPRNDLSQELDGKGYKFQSRPVSEDPNYKFKPGLEAIKPAQDGFAHWPDNWGDGIKSILSSFSDARNRLFPHVSGDLTQAMFANLDAALPVLQDIQNHANVLESLVKHFFEDITTTQKNFLSNESAYDDADKKSPRDQDTINQLNVLAGKYMDNYHGPISDIASRHPSVDDALPMPAPTGPAPVQTSGPPTAPSQGSPMGPTPAGRNTGSPQNVTQPAKTNSASTPKVPTDALNNATGAAKNALGQAGSAASRALGAATNGLGRGGGKLPEGVLGLGTKGLRGTPKSGGTTGGRRGGQGAAGTRTNPAPKVAPASKVSPASTPVSRAGLGGTGGQGGTGTPAAGHRGGEDKQHKAAKALHLAKNTKELLGESDAVAPVLGAPPPKPPPAKPES